MLLQHYVTVPHHSNSFCIKEASELYNVKLTLKNVTLRRKHGRLFLSYAAKSRIWNCWSSVLLFLEMFDRFCRTKRSKGKLCVMKKAVTQRCVETENSASEVMRISGWMNTFLLTRVPGSMHGLPLRKCYGRHFNPSATAEEVFEDTHTHTHTHRVSLSLPLSLLRGFQCICLFGKCLKSCTYFRRSPFLQTNFSDLMKLINNLRTSVRELKHLA